MADSNITKKALAAALKDLMTKMSFSKISVGDICELCQMNRKSFYYHFKDKEDLVNWIFDTEFLAVAKDIPHNSNWEGVKLLIDYFYENRSFYKKALKVEGQNSFSDHLSEICYPVLFERLQYVMKTPNVTEFQVGFFVDGIICGIKRWITSPECITPDEFLEQIASCIYMAAKQICVDIDELKRSNQEKHDE